MKINKIIIILLLMLLSVVVCSNNAFALGIPQPNFEIDILDGCGSHYWWPWEFQNGAVSGPPGAQEGQRYASIVSGSMIASVDNCDFTGIDKLKWWGKTQTSPTVIDVFLNNVEIGEVTFQTVWTEVSLDIPEEYRQSGVQFKMQYKSGNLVYSFDNFTWEAAPPAEITYSGYCKDGSGNPLQYCNVSIGNITDGDFLAWDLTDADGYYSFTHTSVNNSESFLIVRPPNQGATNIWPFYTNTLETDVVHNFTVSPVSLVIFTHDTSTGNLTGVSPANITINKNNEGDITYSGASIPWSYPLILNMTDHIWVNVTAAGYFNATPYEINSIEDNYNGVHVFMYKNGSSGEYVYIKGWTLDNTGVRIPGLNMWLKRSDTGTIEDSSMSVESGLYVGYYTLKVPKTADDRQYEVIIDYPGYGNLTAHLHNGGATTHFGTGTAFTYDDSFAGTTDGNANVDLLLDLEYTPSPTPAPGDDDYIPVFTPPAGKYAIYGILESKFTSTIPSGVTVKLDYQNGTNLCTVTSDANGYYSMIFDKSIPQGYYDLYAVTNDQWDCSDAFYDGFPLPSAFTIVGKDSLSLSFGNLIELNPQLYSLYGYVNDADTGNTINGVIVGIYYANGTLMENAATATNGYYEIYWPSNAPDEAYTVWYNLTGYTPYSFTVDHPGYFASHGDHALKNVVLSRNRTGLGEIYVQVKDDATNQWINGATVTIRYYDNQSVYKGGYTSTYGDNVGVYYVVNVPADTYAITISKTGYGSVTVYAAVTDGVQSRYTIALKPASASATPTANPCYTPTPTPSATAPINALDPLQALFSLLMLIGFDLQTAKIVTGFGFVIGGAIIMAYTANHFGINASGVMLMAIGAAAGFVVASLMSLWPWWILVAAAFLVVGLVVAYLMRQNTGA